MKKVLFLAPELPYPPISGGKIKSWKLLNYLTQHYQVDVASVLKNDDQRQVQPFLKRANIHSFYFDIVKRPRNLTNLLKSYLQGVPLNILRTASLDFKNWVQFNIEKYDLVIVDHYEVFQYIPSNYPGKVVLHQHNAYYLMWQRYAENKQNHWLNRLACFFESKRVKQYEKHACNLSDLVFASPNDITSLEKIGVNPRHCRITYHLGDDSQIELPRLDFQSTQPSLLYVGTLNWQANIDGLLWFIKQVWPEIKKLHPDLSFNIIGKNPDIRLIKAAVQYSDIHFLGFVDDLEPYLKTARLFVAPLQYGAGMKVKVLNAMSRGIPVVTTTIGAEGLEVTNMKHLGIADTPESMQQLILRLLEDKDLWDTFCDESRHLIMEKYTWKKLFSDMNQELVHLLEPQNFSIHQTRETVPTDETNKPSVLNTPIPSAPRESL